MTINKKISVLTMLSLSLFLYSHTAFSQSIAIGSQDPDKRSHAQFPQLPKNLIKVSTHLTIDHAAPKGLNFFAIQVNFPNSTWAHGGLMFSSGKKKMNWGGLVSRGGGSKDYNQESTTKDIDLIQNPVGDLHTGPYNWQESETYTLQIQRGKLVSLPPGNYTFIDNTKPVHVQETRNMWEWTFTIRPDKHPEQVFQTTLYDSSSVFKSFYVWNECGYGSCEQQQHATWSYPEYTTDSAPDHSVTISKYTKF